MESLPLFPVATTAHLGGSLILALFFVLLARHDPRPYLRLWTAAWVAQVAAVAGLLLFSLLGWRAGLAVYLLLEAGHGVLILAAAQSYRHGSSLGRGHVLLLLPGAAWAVAAPLVSRDHQVALAGELVLLAAAYLAATVILWPMREPEMMGLRITTNVLAILGLVYLLHATVFAWAVGAHAGPLSYLEITPFKVLLLQMLLAFGMVLAVMEATQWALTTTNMQLTEAEARLKVLAETDPLTGCFNRRVFRELVDEVRADGASGGVVLLIDMDGLKAINDRQGHAAGDEAIRAVAEAIRSRTRTTDIAVRWGGDEFVVVITGASRAEGEGRRAQIVAAIGEAGLSASAGIASYGPGTDIMDAVQEADATMYQLKAERKRSPAGA